MGYGYTMFKVKDGVLTPDDLSDDTTEVIGEGPEIQRRLSELYPTINWHHNKDTGIISGHLDGADTWYEFMLQEKSDVCFSINTTFRTDSRSLIPEICKSLGLVAFDEQKNLLIGLEID
jgi:hypothetical protein